MWLLSMISWVEMNPFWKSSTTFWSKSRHLIPCWRPSSAKPLETWLHVKQTRYAHLIHTTQTTWHKENMGVICLICLVRKLSVIAHTGNLFPKEKTQLYQSGAESHWCLGHDGPFAAPHQLCRACPLEDGGPQCKHTNIYQCFPYNYFRGGCPPTALRRPWRSSSFYFLCSARSPKKSFNVTFPIEHFYTLFFY